MATNVNRRARKQADSAAESRTEAAQAAHLVLSRLATRGRLEGDTFVPDDGGDHYLVKVGEGVSLSAPAPAKVGAGLLRESVSLSRVAPAAPAAP
jgi:hypothetical protein